jgi:hypothetical protein
MECSRIHIQRIHSGSAPDFSNGLPGDDIKGTFDLAHESPILSGYKQIFF